MIIDILHSIMKYCEFKEQIDIHNINRHTSNNIYIYRLSVNSNDNITENILHQRKYSRLAALLCPNNKNISDINHLKNTLIELDCSGRNSKIDQNGFSCLKFLKVLDCSFNTNISTIEHVAESLEELYCDCYGDNALEKTISQNDINKLCILRVLSCENNPYINNVNHLSGTLEKLYCRGIYCGINQKGITDLKKLKLLDCHGNKEIKDANIFKNSLTELYCSGKCGIKQENIDDLIYLKTLDCACNTFINNIDNFTLEEICCEYSKIDELSVKNIKKLRWHRRIYN